MGGGNKDLFESQGKNLILHNPNRQTGKEKTKQACLSVCTYITHTQTHLDMKKKTSHACPGSIKIRFARFKCMNMHITLCVFPSTRYMFTGT